MLKKSLFDGILGKKLPESAEPVQQAESESSAEPENNGDEIEHLFITEDNKKNKKMKKKTVQKDPRIDTGILRNRIANKIAKMDNQ